MSLASRWHRYWFPEGERLSAAVVRIAVAVCTAWTLIRVGANQYVTAPELAPSDIYHPVGIMMLLGGDLPPPALIRIAEIVAWIGTAGFAVGLFTRTSAALSLAGALLITSFSVSFTPDWPHDHNLPLLALIAMQGTQAGDVLGVDGWLRRRRGRPAPSSNGFAWTPRLVQLTTALMFLAAAAFKLGAGYFTLRWAFSDNLRHNLICQFDLNHIPRTAAAEWLLQAPWRYETIAFLNLCSQMMPFLACLFVKRPLVRFFFGSFFVVESVGIGVVMGLWDPHWFPLFAAFIDWDRLIAWLRQRGHRAAQRLAPVAEPMGPPRRHRGLAIFIALFVGYDVLISFAYPRIDHALNTYPFSAYPMFAIIRAKKPYDVHQTYEFVNGRFELLADAPIDPGVQNAIERDFVYRKLHRIDDPELLRKRLETLVVAVGRRFPHQKLRGVRLYATSYQIPAYPAKAELIPHDIGLMGAAEPDGTFVSSMGRLIRAGASWQLQAAPGTDLRGAPLYVHVDGLPERRPLPSRQDGDRILVDLPKGNIVHVVAQVGGRDVMIARQTRRAWW